jgi:NADH-quinone oxidoreductase subunit J
MNPLQLVFLATGGLTLVAALMVVLSPNLIHAALWLILTLAGVAVLFVLLEAGFLAVVQVAVYIDAIAILIIVAVMLTQRAMRPQPQQANRAWPWAALGALLLFLGLAFLLVQVPGVSAGPAPLTASAEATLEELGKSLVDVNRYVIPFEVASVLLLAALIGAIVVAIPPIRGREGGGEG